MADRIKEQLDLDWHHFLDQLNETYEEGYRNAIRAARAAGTVDRLVLVGVEWDGGEMIHVRLGALVAIEEAGSERG